MQDKNARSRKTDPSQSRGSFESVRSPDTWSQGFVKPDGTWIELFVPERSVLRSGFDLKKARSRLISVIGALFRRVHRTPLPVVRKATPV